MATKRVALVVLALAIGPFFAACGGDDEDEPGTTSTPKATATVAPTATAAPTDEPFEGGQTPMTAAPSPGLTTALLQEIRAAEHAAFDRITFEFNEGGLPGYEVRYVESPIMYDPRGDEMEIEGEAFIVIRMEPGAGHDPDTGQDTYGGPLELTLGLPTLLEAERVGDFEGVLSWALGLSAEVDFRVTALEDPPRLAIDVAHE